MDRLEDVARYIEAHPGTSGPDVMRALGINQNTGRNYVRRLRRAQRVAVCVSPRGNLYYPAGHPVAPEPSKKRQVLECLAAQDHQTNRQLAAETGIERRLLNAAVNRLKVDGLVNVAPPSAHKGPVVVSLTDEGKASLAPPPRPSGTARRIVSGAWLTNRA